MISNPIMFHLMLRLPASKQFDLSSLTSVCLAGEHMPSELIEAMQTKTSIADVTVGLFSTEVPSMPLFFPIHGNPAKLIGTAGTVAEHYGVRVVDDTGKPVPVGETGQLQLQPIGGSAFLGYLNDPEATKKRYKDGWISTGDMAAMDSEGYVKLMGLKSDLIVRNKQTIYPLPYERSLAGHKLVVGCQAIGVGDQASGDQKLCLYVQPNDRGGEADRVKLKTDLMALCKEAKLPEPDHILFIKDFPRTLTKKVQKYKLKKMAPDLIKNAK